jgi:HSP20 family protein
MLPELWNSRGTLKRPAFDDVVERFFSGWPNVEMTGEELWAPRADIHETNKEVFIDLELPGMKKDEIKIEVRNNVLTISGERKHERKTETTEGSRIERHYGKFERSFTLPETVSEDKISAGYTNGVLTLTLPKTEKALPKEITVEVK